MIKQTDLPLVSLASMNEVHFEEIVIINTLLEELTKKEDFEVISKSLENLLEHMQQHFAGEEKLMKELQYPTFNLHKSDHDKVLNALRYTEMQWRNKKDVEALKEYIEDDVAVWLDQHIKAMDTPMADFISQSTGI